VAIKPKDCPAAVLTAFVEGVELAVGCGTEVNVGTMSFSPFCVPLMNGFTLGDSTTTVVVDALGAAVVGVVVDVVEVVEVVVVVEVVEVVEVVVVVVTAAPAPVNRTVGEYSNWNASAVFTAFTPAMRASYVFVGSTPEISTLWLADTPSLTSPNAAAPTSRTCTT
jgi:hypothetical protein